MSQRRSTTPLFELLDLNKSSDQGQKPLAKGAKAGQPPAQGQVGHSAPTQPPSTTSPAVQPSAPSTPAAPASPAPVPEAFPAVDRVSSAGPASAPPSVESAQPPPTVQIRPVQIRPPAVQQPQPVFPQAAEASETPADGSSWAHVPRPEEPRPMLAQGLGRPAIVGRLIVLPVPFALIGLGVLIALGAGLWGIAWSTGAGQAREQERARAAAMGSNTIVDPISRPTQVTETPPQQISPQQTPPRQAQAPVQQQPQQRPQATQTPPTAPGDPRQDGYNYLRLANLNQEQAQAAVDRLRLGGLEAFAVPLESAARRGNNPPRFAVYLAQGFPGGQFSASRRDRERLEQAVLRVGQAWAQEGGPTDFRSPFWDKYAP